MHVEGARVAELSSWSPLYITFMILVHKDKISVRS